MQKIEIAHASLSCSPENCQPSYWYSLALVVWDWHFWVALVLACLDLPQQLALPHSVKQNQYQTVGSCATQWGIPVGQEIPIIALWEYIFELFLLKQRYPGALKVCLTLCQMKLLVI